MAASNWSEDALVVDGVHDVNYRQIEAGTGYFDDNDPTGGFRITGFICPGYARLIAAAPELLEALEMLYDKWENGDPCYEDADTLSGSLGNAFRLSEEEESLILNLLKKAGR